MNVLLQKNIWNEYGYDRLIKSIENAGLNYKEVHVIPFTDEFDEPVDMVPDLIFGSGRFVNICRAKGFPTFPSFDPVEKYIFRKDLWINGNGIVATWGELNDPVYKYLDQPAFVKPFTEKFFTGRIIENREDLQKVQLATSFIEDENKELVWVSPVVNIKAEARFFVIGTEIATGSMYKENGAVKHYRIDYNHEAWIKAESIVNSASETLPTAFVLDLGRVNGEWKIVELNNFNSSGLYETDTDAIVRYLQIMLTLPQ